jgi:hypothetical protein
MRTQIDALATMHSLQQIHQPLGVDPELLLDSVSRRDDQHLFRNVCARLSVPLADHLDQVVGTLDCVKRRFIEAAIIDAINRAEAIMQEEGVYDALVERSSAATSGEAV